MQAIVINFSSKMTVEPKKENKPNDNLEEQSKEWSQIFAVFCASLAALSNSLLFNWTSPSIPILISGEYEGIDLNLASYLTVIPPIFSIIAAPLYGISSDHYGRKPCLLSCGVLHTGAWICVIFSRDLYIFYLSRILCGFASAAMISVLPAYISEVSTPKIRGRWGNLMGFFLYFGQLVMNAVGNFFDIKTSACILIAIPIAFLMLFLFNPETPYYYLMMNKPKKAEESLKWLRRLKNVDVELSQLTEDVKRQLSESGNFKDCVNIKSNRKAILIICVTRAMPQLSGVTAFAVYNQYIFQEAGNSLDKGYSSMIYAFILSIMNFVALIFIDKLGRKKPMVISTIGCFIFLSAQTIYFFLKQYTSVDVSSINWFPLIGMVLYVIAFSAGLGLVPLLLLGELFSTSIRSKASTISTIFSAIILAVLTKVFQILVSSYGLVAPFALFSICTFVNIFLSYFYIPETKGKTLEEIQQMLKGNSDVKRSNKS